MLKKLKTAVALTLVAVASSCGPSLPDGVKEILANISEPQFRNADYNVLDFGAVADGTTDCRAAINDAITLCSDEGGGRVVLPDGKFFCKGPIVLKSNVNLHLSDSTEVVFSENPADYLPGDLTVWEGTEVVNYSSLVRAWHCSNIAITGRGTLNGSAKNTFAKMHPQKSVQQDSLRQMGIDLVPVRERYFGAHSMLPPNMIEPYGCKNVLFESFTVLDSPFWVIHPLFCDNVTVRGVTINSYNRNNDGCDPEYSTNVLIEKCTFNTGDDAIAIKAGRDQDAWKIGQKTSGIVIRDCEFSSLCNGLCIGSEMAAGVENVYMYNVHIGSCHRGIYFKSNLDRGGFIRNVRVQDVVCDSVRTGFICFENNYHGGRGGFHPTTFENFRISDVSCRKSAGYGFFAVGVEGHPIRNVVLENVEIGDAATPYVLQIAEDIHFKNVRIGGVTYPEIPEQTPEN